MPAHSIHVSIRFIFSIHMSFTKNRNWIACVNSAEVLLLAKEKMQGIKITCFYSCLPFSECSQWCGSKDSTISAPTLTPTHKLKFWLFWIWRGRDFSPQIIWWRKSLTVSWVLIPYGIKLTTKISLHNILFFLFAVFETDSHSLCSLRVIIPMPPFPKYWDYRQEAPEMVNW